MRAALLASVCLLASPASAGIFSGSDIATACSDSDAYYNYGRCVGFVVGVHDAAIAIQPGRFCVPLDRDDIMVTEDVLQPVLDALASATSDQNAADLTLASFEVHFPC
jgi:hypothetical protein